MLEDRFYMRRTESERRLSATVILLIANAMAFLIQQGLYAYYPNFPTDHFFALSASGLRAGFLWQLLSYQFMHGGFMHLAFNCFAIYMFGRDVEEALGRRPFYTLYFTSGIVGGLFQALAGVFLNPIFGGPVVGASAAAFGLTAAYALLFPEATLLLFFVIPLRAKWLLVLSVAVAVGGIFMPEDTKPNAVHIAHAAHLGGMLAGVLFVRYVIHWNFRLPRFKAAGLRPPRRLVEAPARKSGPWRQSENSLGDEMPTEEFVSKQVDPILDKISAHGIQSLTERERRILERAREKIERR